MVVGNHSVVEGVCKDCARYGISLCIFVCIVRSKDWNKSLYRGGYSLIFKFVDLTVTFPLNIG